MDDPRLIEVQRNTAEGPDRIIGPALPVCILILAFGLRAIGLDLVPFQIDEGVAAALATQVGHLRTFPSTGVATSFGFHNPPTLFYMLAPWFRMTRNPALVGLFPAILGTIAVALSMGSARRMAGRPAALATGLLLAVCPNAVEHSRRLWGHDFIIFWSALTIWLSLRARHRASSGWLVAAWFAAALGASLHLSGLLLAVVPALVLLRAPLRRRWVGVLGLLAFPMVWMPWIANEAGTHWEETAHIARMVRGGVAGAELHLAVSPLAAWTQVLGDFWTNDLLGETRPFDISSAAFVASLGVILAGTLMLGLGLSCAAMKLGRKPGAGAALALQVVATPILFGVLFRGAVPPYQLPALVPAAILGGVAMARWRRIGVPLLAIFTTGAVVLVIAVRLFIGSGEAAGIPLGEKQHAVEVIAKLRGSEGFHLHQDARAPESGMDVAWLYLLYASQEDGALITSPTGAPQTIVLRDDRTMMRIPPSAFLGGLPVTELPHLRIYRLDEKQATAWRELLRRHPAPQR